MKNKSAIRRLLLDDPCAIDSACINEKQARLLDVLSDLEDKIKDLDENTVNLFEQFRNALDDLCYEEMCCYFERGIKFGVLFGMELAEE